MFPLWRLRVLTPAQRQLDVEGVRWIRVQLADGAGISIWPGHGPLLAETVQAPVRYQDSKGEHGLLVGAGILQVTSGLVSIYASSTDSDAPARSDPDVLA